MSASPLASAPESLSPFSPARRPLSTGLLLGVLIIAFESLAVATALPAVARELNGLKLYGWPLSAFFMGFMVGTVGLGALADRDGPARPALIALLLFAAGLVVAGLAPSMAVLIGGRVVQGLGGGGLLAAAYLVINTAYPDAMRARMLALLSSAWVLPALLGPALSSFITQQWSWRGVFLGLLPLVGLAGALMLPQLVKLRGAGTPLDRSRLGAVVLAALGTSLGLTGLTELGQGRSLGALGLGSLGLLLGALIAVPALGRLFPARVWRTGTPLSAGYATRFLLAFAFFGTESLLPLGLAELRGLSLLSAGLFLTGGALTWSATSFVQSRFDERTQGRQRPKVVRLGAAAIGLGMAGLLTALLVPALPLALAAGCWGLAALGMGLAFPAHTLVVMQHAPAGQQGQVSGTLQLSDMLGSALGAGLGGALVAALGTAAGVPWQISLTIALAVLTVLLAGRLHGGSEAGAPDLASDPAHD
ncbi:MFS transporter [Deinococcus rubellus]|uniref:MFS transporter n=1 Tax=Deinococcus rubellus TaxID=1889240 RepID=A0ABY5YJM9_9DEIO|nr:MFS transporter [Deinococcus rubellus]UWX64464.1 MFS transporter [Deinococcus rubellus]